MKQITLVTILHCIDFSIRQEVYTELNLLTFVTVNCNFSLATVNILSLFCCLGILNIMWRDSFLGHDYLRI
jgi:hypothetical protein